MTARLSIVPGRFIEDARADLNHYKVLTALGRHTNKDGWCQIKQATIGGIVGLTRETVNRRIKDLVEWGYVQRHSADATGRSIYYRVLLDSPALPVPDATPGTPDDDLEGDPAIVSDDASEMPDQGELPVIGTSHVAATCEAGVTPGVTTHDHTRCDAQAITPGVTSAITQNDVLQRPFSTTPPSPPAQPADGEGGGGELPGRRSGGLQRPSREATSVEMQALGALIDDGRHLAAVEHLLAPILRRRKITHAPDVLHTMRAIRDKAKDQPVPVLARAAEIVIDTRETTVREGNIVSALATAAADHAAARKAQAVQARVEADPALGGQWRVFMAAAEQALGEAKCRAWMSGVVPRGIEGADLVIAAGSGVHAKHIREALAPSLTPLASKIWPAVRRIEVVVAQGSARA